MNELLQTGFRDVLGNAIAVVENDSELRAASNLCKSFFSVKMLLLRYGIDPTK